MENSGFRREYLKIKKNSAICLYYNDIFIGTIYFKDTEDITIDSFNGNLLYSCRNGYMIYFTHYVIKEDFI